MCRVCCQNARLAAGVDFEESLRRIGALDLFNSITIHVSKPPHDLCDYIKSCGIAAAKDADFVLYKKEHARQEETPAVGSVSSAPHPTTRAENIDLSNFRLGMLKDADEILPLRIWSAKASESALTKLVRSEERRVGKECV